MPLDQSAVGCYPVVGSMPEFTVQKDDLTLDTYKFKHFATHHATADTLFASGVLTTFSDADRHQDVFFPVVLLNHLLWLKNGGIQPKDYLSTADDTTATLAFLFP